MALNEHEALEKLEDLVSGMSERLRNRAEELLEGVGRMDLMDEFDDVVQGLDHLLAVIRDQISSLDDIEMLDDL